MNKILQIAGKKGWEIQKKKLGKNMSKEMARRVRLGHQAQIKIYGSYELYRAEMKRRSDIAHKKVCKGVGDK